MINYIIIDVSLNVMVYYEYVYYNDVIRYYDVGNELHKHECVNSHYTLMII